MSKKLAGANCSRASSVLSLVGHPPLFRSDGHLWEACCQPVKSISRGTQSLAEGEDAEGMHGHGAFRNAPDADMQFIVGWNGRHPVPVVVDDTPQERQEIFCLFVEVVVASPQERGKEPIRRRRKKTHSPRLWRPRVLAPSCPGTPMLIYHECITTPAPKSAMNLKG